MPTMKTRWKLAALALACFVASVWYLGSTAHGRFEEDGRAAGLMKKSTRVQEVKDRKPKAAYYGVGACSNKGCHGGEPPVTWIRDKELFVRCNEAVTWSNRDKHAAGWK